MLLYGMGNLSLAKDLGLTSTKSKTDIITVNYGRFSMQMSLHDKDLRDQAGVYKKMYFKALKGAQDLIKQINRAGTRRGYIFNFVGRRRRIKDERTYRYVNSLIQGSGADVMKITLGRLEQYLRGTKSRLLLTVHDEVHIELHKDDIPLIPKLRAIMEDFNLSVPLTVELSWSPEGWADKRPIDTLERGESLV